MGEGISWFSALAVALGSVAILIAGLSYAQYRQIVSLYRESLNAESDWRQRALHSENKLVKVERAWLAVERAGNEAMRTTALQRLELVMSEPIVIPKITVEDGRARSN